jgi:hypothetical protein
MDGMQIGKGHNSDPVIAAALDPEILRDQLKLDHAALFTRFEELMAEALRFGEQFPKGPTNDDEQGKAGDLVKDIKLAAKEAVAAHAAAKKPYLECGREVDVTIKQNIADRLSGTAAKIEGMMGGYARAKVERERKAAQELRDREAAEARRLADEAAALMASNPIAADAVMEQAVQAADASDSAASRADGRINDLSRTQGTFGSNTSLQDNWVYKVVDFMALVRAVADGTAPPHYLQVNESALGGAVRVKGGLRELPGVLIENQPKARVR